MGPEGTSETQHKKLVCLLSRLVGYRTAKQGVKEAGVRTRHPSPKVVAAP